MNDLTGIDTSTDTGSTFPAVRLTRGGRTIYQLALRSKDFAEIVPSSPSKVAQQNQRGYTETHATAIARYMIANPDSWAFGPISLALTNTYMDWEPFNSEADNGVSFGRLTLKAGYSDMMLILDGQHRRGAIHILRTRHLPRVSKQQYAQVEKGLDHSEMSVDLYAIDEAADVRRVFAWMNTSRKLSAAEKVLLDDGDPFNQAAQRIVGSFPDKFRADRIAWFSDLCIPLMNASGRSVPQTVGLNSLYWMNAKQLKILLIARTLGKSRTPRTTAPAMIAWSPPAIIAAGKKLLNDELPLLRPEWQALRDKRTRATDLQALRTPTIVYDAHLALAAAASLHSWEDQGLLQTHGIEPLAQVWQELDLGVENPSLHLTLRNRHDPPPRRPAMAPSNAVKSGRAIATSAAEPTLAT